MGAAARSQQGLRPRKTAYAAPLLALEPKALACSPLACKTGWTGSLPTRGTPWTKRFSESEGKTCWTFCGLLEATCQAVLSQAPGGNDPVANVEPHRLL